MEARDADTSGRRPERLRVGLVRGEVPFDRGEDRDDSFMLGYEEALEAALAEGPDLLVGAEYAFYPNVPISREERDALWGQMLELSAEHPDTLLLPGTYIWQDGGKLHNTLPAFYRGELVESYDKQRPANGEMWVARDNDLEYEAEPSRGVVEHRGLSIGLEVCYDHDAGELASKGVEGLDLQVLVANGKEFIEENAVVRRGGYHIRCDGAYSDGVEVNRRTKGDRFERVDAAYEAELPHGLELAVYELETG